LLKTRSAGFVFTAPVKSKSANPAERKMLSNLNNILIVEDDKDTAQMLIAYFEAQGYGVTSAAWGQDALRLAQNDPVPDLILLDIRLPDMDGYEVCKQLRAQRRTHDIPIIFLTERRERNDKLSGLELGAVDYITKPFDIQELKLRVRNALERSRFQTLVDPITSLPTEQVTDDRLHALLAKSNWALLLISVDGLDAFADRYGFVARDDVLRALALVLSNSSAEGQVDPEASFVGQMSSTHFIIITPANRLHDLQERIAVRLKQAVTYFYPAKERTSASGKRPPLNFMLGVVTEQQGPFPNAESLKAAAVGSLKAL
jgi:DNA-binding response OmpR family regulator